MSAMSLATPPWMQEASCLGSSPDLWFPSHDRIPQEAKAICAACPVRSDCLEYALADRRLSGIWAGTSASDRRRLRLRRTGQARRVRV